MNILVDILHPAHVHFFRHAIAEWQRLGHDVAITARRKDVTLDLLDGLGLKYAVLSTVGRGLAGLGIELVRRDLALWRFCRRFRPNVLTGISGMFVAHVGRLIKRPSVVWDDTEHQHLAHRLTWPFATAVYSPQSYLLPPARNQYFYPGCHKLAYMHPKRFTPDPQLVRSLGIDPDSRYCIIRFVSFGAHHDVGQHGLSVRCRLDFIRAIEPHARPYITSEAPLPPDLQPWQLRIPPHLFHHVLALARLCVAEGATVATEAALLGVPAVYVNTLRAGTLNRLEAAGLLRQTADTDEALQLALAILADPIARPNALAARNALIAKEIDVSSFVADTVLRYGSRT